MRIGLGHVGGLGLSCVSDDAGNITCYNDDGTINATSSPNITVAPSQSPSSGGVFSNPGSINALTNLITSAGRTIGQTLNPTQIVSANGLTYAYNPTTGQVSPLDYGLGLGSLSQYLPLLLIGGVVLLVVSGGRR